MTDQERWERFIEFTEAIRKICGEFGAGMYTADDLSGILVRFQESSGASAAGIIIAVTPGRMLYAHPPTEKK